MPNIDERVVQMQFDNKQFEQGVAESLRTLDKLKDKLNLEESSKSLIHLDKVISDLNFTPLEEGVNSVARAFTPLGRIAQKTFDDIAAKAINAGKQMVGMITGFNDMMAGKAKYEMETRSVMTIQNATGKSLEEVEAVLKNLMHYTDETSYDFAQMASSIGKFTSVGVDLETAEQAMEGIANWAAKSGADKMAANRAMYNISQAMGTGSMMIRDWMSIENANMATKEFKETAIETAIEMGVLQRKAEGVGSILSKNSKGAIKETIVDYQTFRETLSDHWLTSEVLTETLRKYGDQTTQFGLDAFHAAQNALTFTEAIDAVKDAVSSGWMETMQHVFGNLDEARVFWTDLATWMQEFAAVFSDSRNHLLEGWHDLGGYKALIETFTNVWRTFENIVLGVRQALQEVFPPETAEHLVYLTERVRDATGAFRRMFAIDRWEEGEEVLEEVVDHAENLSKSLKVGDSGEDVIELMDALRTAGYDINLSEGTNEWGIYDEGVKKTIEKLQNDLHVGITGEWDEVTRKAAIAKGIFKETVEVTEEGVVQTDFFSKGMSRVQEIVKGVAGVLKIAVNILKGGFEIATSFLSIFTPVIDLLGRFGSMFGMMFKNLSDDIERGGAISEFVESITAVFEPLANAIQTVTQFFHDFINVYAEALRDSNRRNTFGNFFTFLANYLKNDTILAPITSMAEGALGLVLRIAGTIISIITNVVGTVGSLITELFGFGNTDINSERSGLIIFLETVYNYVYIAGQALTYFLEIAKNVILGVSGSILRVAGPAIKVISEVAMSAIYMLLQNLPVIMPMLIKLAPVILAIIAALTMYRRAKGPVAGMRMSLLSLVGALGFFIAATNKDKIIGFFTSVYGRIKEYPIVTKMVTVIQSLIDKFKEWFKLGEDGSELNLFERIKTGFKSMSTFVLQKLHAIGQSFTSLFNPKGTGEEGLSFIERFKNRLAPLADWIVSIATTIQMAISDIFNVDIIEMGQSLLGHVLGNIKGMIKMVADTAKEILTSDYIGTILTGIFAVGFFNIGRGIANMGRSLEGAIKALKGINNKDTFGNAALKFAGAVAIISAAMVALSMIKFERDPNGALNGLDTFVTIVIAVAGAISALKLLDHFLNRGKNKNDSKVSTILLEFAGSIAAISVALLLIQHFLKGDWAGTIALLGGIILALVGVQYLMLKMTAKSGRRELSSSVSGIFDLCKGLLAIAGAISLLAIFTTLLPTGTEKALGMLTKILVILGVITLAMTGMTAFNGKKGSVEASVKGISAICVGLLAVAGAITLLSVAMMIPGNHVIAAFAMMFVIILELSALTGVMTYFASKNGKGKAVSSAANIVSLCVGVMAIVEAMAKMSGLLKTYGWYVAGATVLISGITVLISGMAIWMNKISKDHDWKSGLSSIAPIVAMISGVMVIVNSIGKMASLIDKYGDKAYIASAIISGIMVLISGMAIWMNSISKESDWRSGLASILPIIAIIGGVFAIAEILSSSLTKVKDIDPRTLAVFIGGIVAVLLIAGSMATVLVGMKAKASTMVEVALGIAAVMAGIAGGLWVMLQLGASSISSASDSLVILGYALSSFSDSISQINWENIDKVYDFIVNKLPNLMASLLIAKFDEAVQQAEKLTKIGAQLCLFSDNISGVSGSSATNIQNAIALVEGAKTITDTANSIVMPEIIRNAGLISIGTELWLYSASMDGISTDGLQRAIDTANNAKTVADIISSIGLNDGINTTLTEFGSAIKLYYAAVAGAGLDENGNPIEVNENATIDPDVLNAVMSGLAKSIDVDTIDQISSYAEGEDHDMTKMALGITAIGTALSTYATDIKSINIDDVNAANRVMDTIATVYEKLTGSNLEGDSEYLKSINTDSVLGQFSKGIVAIGEAIGKYKDEIGGIKPSEVRAANRVIEAVTGLDKYLNSKNTNTYMDINGMSQSMADQNTIENFAGQLVTLGNGIRRYCWSTFGVTDTNLTNAERVISFVAGLQDTLPKTGSVISKFFVGEQSLENFAAGLTYIGSGINSYKKLVGDLTITDSDVKAFTGIKLIAEGLGAMGKTGGLDQFFNGTFSWEKIFEGLPSVPEKLKQFQDMMNQSGFNPSMIEDSLIALERLASVLGTFKAVYDTLNDGWDGNVFDSITAGLTNLMVFMSNNTLEELFGVNIEQAKQFGKSFAESIQLGIEEATSDENGTSTPIIQKALQTILQSAIENTKTQEYQDKFKDIGVYLCQGMANGIHDGLMDIIKAIKTMDESIIEEAQEGVEVRSPSRKFQWIGQMCALGLANGFNKYSYLVTDAANVLASGSVESIMAAFKPEKLNNVGTAALASISELLLKGDKDAGYGEKEMNIVKQMLVSTKYLAKESINDIDAVKQAIINFKREVLYDKDFQGALTGDWGYDDSLKLWQQVHDTLYGGDANSWYNAQKYNAEMLEMIGGEAVDLTDQMVEANERLAGSVESLADMYATLSDEQKKIVDESVNPDWMTETVYWSNIGDELFAKYGNEPNPMYDFYHGNKDLTNYDSPWNDYFKNPFEGMLDSFGAGMGGFDMSQLSGLFDSNLFGDGSALSGMLNQGKTALLGMFTGEDGLLAGIGSDLFSEGGLISKVKDGFSNIFTGEDGLLAGIGSKLFGEEGLINQAADGVKKKFIEIFAPEGELAQSLSENPIDIGLRPVLTTDAEGEDGIINGAYNYNVAMPESLTADLSTDAAQIITSSNQSQVDKLLELKQAMIDTGANNVNAIGNVNDKIAMLSTDIRGLRMYVDGNRLLGWITPRIDASLGERAFQVGRMTR